MPRGIKRNRPLLNDHVVVAYTTADAPSEYEGEFVFVSVRVRDQLAGHQYS